MRLTALDDQMLYALANWLREAWENATPGPNAAELHVVAQGWEFRYGEGEDQKRFLIEPDGVRFPLRKILFAYEGEVEDIATEDSGMAKIATLRPDEPEEDAGLFVRVQSWDEDAVHADFEQLASAPQVRVTVEILEDSNGHVV